MNMTEMKHLFKLTTIHDFKLYSLSLQLESKKYVQN